jgi:D-alanyl-D-alanine carboxypeptidase
MIGFSSNANAEYLMRLLGQEEIQDLGRQWGLPSHTSLVPLVGSLVAAQNEPGAPHLRAKSLRERTETSYRANAWAWSDSLAADFDERWTNSQTKVDLSLQRVWSSRLSAASAADYAAFAERLNLREGLDDATIPWLEQSVEIWRSQFDGVVQAGGKGGSTGFLLNQCLYGIREDGSRFALALFIHDLNPVEMAILNQSMGEFESRLWVEPLVWDEWSHHFPVDGE